MTVSDSLKARFRKVPEPENLYRGLRLPEGFELPDEILLFYHDFCAASPNAHSRYTVVFPLADMSYFVDKEKYSLHEGDILFIRPYSLRFLSPESSGYQRFFITFQLKKDQNYLPKKTLLRWTGPVGTLLRKMLGSYAEGKGTRLAAELYELLSVLTPAEDGRAENTPEMSMGIARALEFINENLHKPIDNRQIAKRAGMSVSNMARCFRNEIGMPVYKYILRQRLEFARYYLEKTGMPVDEIAAKCGFESPSGFCHFFKAKTGFPPLTYRKKSPR